MRASFGQRPLRFVFAANLISMTMWAETQTHRFAAAVAGAGLSDWLSYYGVNEIDEWMIPFFGASVYDDPAVYAKSDPMLFSNSSMRTPALVAIVPASVSGSGSVINSG